MKRMCVFSCILCSAAFPEQFWK